MPTTLHSATKPALALEIAELLRAKEAALATPQTRVAIAYGNSASTPRIVSITASLPITRTRDASDAGTKFVYSDYAPDAVTLTGTPLAGLAVEGLAEALGVICEEIDAAETARLAGGGTIPSGVGTQVTYTSDTASIDCTLAYNVVVDATGKPQPTVVNHLA